MVRPKTLLGVELTPAEADRLLWIQAHGYRDPRTKRNLTETLATMDRRLDYQTSDEAGRAALRHWMRERFRRRALAAATEPNSAHYMRDTVQRAACLRLDREAATQGLTIQDARRRSRHYALKRWDADVIALHDRAFGFGGVR